MTPTVLAQLFSRAHAPLTSSPPTSEPPRPVSPTPPPRASSLWPTQEFVDGVAQGVYLSPSYCSALALNDLPGVTTFTIALEPPDAANMVRQASVGIGPRPLAFPRSAPSAGSQQRPHRYMLLSQPPWF